MITLRPFQKEGVRMIYRFGGRSMLCDDQGLGKTVQALEWIRLIPSRRPVVIVCLSSVKYQWKSEAKLHFGMRTTVVEGRCKDRRRLLKGEIIIINFDILASWLPVLRRMKPKVVVIDEGQMVKNHRARRTKTATELAHQADSVLLLTGTPIPNRLIDLWAQINIVRPDLYPNRMAFAWEHCEPKLGYWGWEFKGARKKKQLRRLLLKECMIRRLKKDVAPELPDKIHKVVPFHLKDRREYQRATTSFLTWLKETSPARAHRARNAQALVRVGYLLRLCARLKLPWTIKWMEEFAECNPGTKVVCMTMHTFVIDALRERFPNSVVVNGAVTGKKRERAVWRFNTDRRIQWFLGNWKAAGAGLNLQVSSNFVSLDLPWTPGDLAQGQDRVHRIGQNKAVVVHYLMLLNTIEEKLWEILRKKTLVLEAVLNGRNHSNDLDVFELLLKSMQK